MRTTQLTSITEDFIQVALKNDFVSICVNDYKLYSKYRLQGIRLIRAVKEGVAVAYDTLGNKTIVTPQGNIIQL